MSEPQDIRNQTAAKQTIIECIITMSDSEESCAGYSTSSDSNVLSSSDGTDISLPDLEVTPPPVVEEEDNQNVQVGGDKRPAADDGWGSLEPRRVRRRADPVAAAPVQQQADDQDAPQQQQQGIQVRLSCYTTIVFAAKLVFKIIKRLSLPHAVWYCITLYLYFVCYHECISE